MLPQVQMHDMGNMGGYSIQNGMQKLAGTQGIFIKQKFEAIEAMTGCETPNVYKVYPADINGTQIGKRTIFKCKEKSGCLSRNCLPGDCRPFNMKVSNEEGTMNDKSIFLQLERPFKCTCLCLARPEMSVNMVENGQNNYFGKIVNPCKFCDLGGQILDSANNIKYIIEGSCCQLGYCCMGCPCKSCQEYTFEVKNGSGDVVTRIVKQSAGCFKACVGDADYFALGFPPNCSPEDKVLLLASALFLDYMYFENKHDEKQSN